MASLIISGVDRAIDNMGVLSAFRFLKVPFQKWAYRIQAELATYPPPIPSGLFMATATEKQKKAFFALLSAGLIPSGRTGDLGRRWTTDVRVQNLLIEAKVGNKSEYGTFVQGEHQQPFHSGRWTTDEEALDLFRNRIIQDIEAEIRKNI